MLPTQYGVATDGHCLRSEILADGIDGENRVAALTNTPSDS